MADHPAPAAPAGPTDHPEVAHEHSDVRVRPIFCFVGGLLVVAVIVHIGLWFLLRSYLAEESAAKESEFPLAVEARRQGPILPPAPRLEGIDPEHRGELCAPPWAQQLSPSDEARVRAAMKDLAGKLPAREPAEKYEARSVNPNDANGGRTYERGRP